MDPELSNIPKKYIFPCPSRHKYERRCIFAAHIDWVRKLCEGRKIPDNFIYHETHSEDIMQALLSQGIQSLGPSWTILEVAILNLSTHQETLKELIIPANMDQVLKRRNMSWSQKIDFILESNFNFLWQQPQINFLVKDEPKTDTSKSSSGSGWRKKHLVCDDDLYLEEHMELASGDDKQFKKPAVTIESSEAMHFDKLLKILYPSVSGDFDGNGDFSNGRKQFDTVSNLLQPITILKMLNEQTQSCKFLIFYPFILHNVRDAVTFSPQKLNNSASKILFIIFQIINFIQDFKCLRLPLNHLRVTDIRIDESLYVSIMPNFQKILESYKIKDQGQQPDEVDPEVKKAISSAYAAVRKNELVDYKVCMDPEMIEAVIRHWCQGLITNYEYLIFLNYLAGRFCDGNPNFHPVFPWVSDFSESFGGWRELTRSKFRLNKGDRQLDLMYEEGDLEGSNVPHHVTDILSEITFYVYKARRTPKEVLKKFVRPNWVPAEYPVSIQRMQEWTPDECIPEFYDDPSLFKSIHEDLPDLQVPKWAESPEAFITQHRRLLESEFVSGKLHHWIDLTFGYKLCGTAAVKAKNIYLSLVDNHQNLQTHGMVQLFQTPHPPRRCPIRNLKNVLTFENVKKMYETKEVSSKRTSDASLAATVSEDVKPKKLSLPKIYDSMGFLNDLEVSLNFFKSHFPYLDNENIGIALDGLNSTLEVRPSPAAIVFGCIMVELVLVNKVRHVSHCLASLSQRYQFYKKYLQTNFHHIPLFCKRAVQTIFLPETLDFSIPLEISTDFLLIGDNLGPLWFPKYYDELLRMIHTMKNYDRILKLASPVEASPLKFKTQEIKVKAFSRDFIQIIESLDDSGIRILEPFILELISNPETRVLAVWNLFCPFARAIGRKRAHSILLGPLIQLYESNYFSDKHLKLFHRTFLLQLCSCFGMEVFLKSFAPLLIEAVGGYKSPVTTRTHLSSKDFDIEVPCEKDSGITPKHSYSKNEPETLDSNYQLNNTSGAEPEMFILEPELSDSEGNDTSSGHSVASVNNFPIESSTAAATPPDSTAPNQPSDQGVTLQLCNPEGSSQDSASDDSGEKETMKYVSDISEMSSESIMWLAHRIGPVLTAKYITKNLLKMLTLCFYCYFDAQEDINAMNLESGAHCQRVLHCLMTIADLYGECFIERQYLPHCMVLISTARNKMNATTEAGLLGVSVLLERIFQDISECLLLSQIKEPIIRAILSPLVNLVCSDDTCFPSGYRPKLFIATKALSMMNDIKKKIGPDLSMFNLRPVLLVICSTFHAVYSGKAKAGMETVFGPKLASQTRHYFCDIIIGSEHEALMRDICLKETVDNNSKPDVSSDTKKTAENESGKNMEKKRLETQSSFASRSFGNRIHVSQEVEGSKDHAGDGKGRESHSKVKKDCSRHLKGNWIAYWENEIGRCDSHFDIKQMKLQSFAGHSGGVRFIHVLDNENSFLTASKDKTVKLFSLRNQGDENTTTYCQWAYTHHKKAVLSVLFQEQVHLAASTDGVIHLWDPFVGKTLRVLDKEGSSKSSQICCLRPIRNSHNFLGAGMDTLIQVVDTRTCLSYELKAGINQPSGPVRCMAVSDSGNIVSVGHSSGMISSLDLRTGYLLGSWKAHEGEVLQMCGYKDYLISTSFDQAISVWNWDDNKLAFQMRGQPEPTHCLWTFQNELISCTTMNKIGVHTKIDPNASFSSNRLRTDVFKGVVTCMRILPMNQMILLGSETGNVVLLC